jgi:hypothetical protein
MTGHERSSRVVSASEPDSSGSPATGMDRRRFLVAGGAAATLTAVLVACAQEDDAIPVSGEVVPPSSVAQPPVTDAVYIRTSQSVICSGIESYGTLLELGVLSPEDEELLSFVRDRHVEQLGLLTEAAQSVDGEGFEEPNPFIDETVVAPSIEAIDAGGNDPMDVLRYANAYESLIASTLQGFVPSVVAFKARGLMGAISGAENRNAAVIVSRIEGFTVVGAETAAQAEAASGSAPLLTGPGATANTAPDTAPDSAAPLPVSQVPGAFASLAAVEVVLGGESLTWQTPGPNSYIYG